MKQADIVIIGGSAAGLAAAFTARHHHGDKSITLVRKESRVLIPCGIPYIFGTLGSSQKNLIPDAGLQKHRVDLLLAEVTDVDRETRTVYTTEGEIRYERLVLAMGSRPAMPPIPGFDLDGVFAAVKDAEFLDSLRKRLEAVARAQSCLDMSEQYLVIICHQRSNQYSSCVTLGQNPIRLCL